MDSGPGPGPGPGHRAAWERDHRLSPVTASALLAAYTLLDAPRVIRARIASVTFSTILASLSTFTLLLTGPMGNVSTALHAMGYWPVGIVESIKVVLLTATLFAGPLYEALLIDGLWEDWVRLRPLTAVWSQWTNWRNIVMGPVTEEVLFRSAAVPLLLSGHMSLVKVVVLSPIIFGLAHIHHFYEFRITHPSVPILAALARSVFQLMYTSLFGAYATFLFLRTGSLLAVVLVHAFCNSMGLPRLWGRLQPYWLEEGNRDPNHRAKTTLFVTALYYALLLGGLIVWRRNLLPLSESSNRLVTL